jgi:hypothetical protein
MATNDHCNITGDLKNCSVMVDDGTMVRGHASDIGMNAIDSFYSGFTGHGATLKKFKLVRGLMHRPHCWPEFHGRRPYGGGCDDDGNGGSGARHNEY